MTQAFPKVTKVRTVSGALVGGMLYLGFQLWTLSRRAGVEEVPLPKEKFPVDGPATKEIGWTDKDDQLTVVEKLSDDQKTILSVAHIVDKESRKLKGHGRVYFRQGLAHNYFFHTNATLIPQKRLPVAVKSDNHNWLRGLLSCFAPYGYELPSQEAPPIERWSLDSNGDAVMTLDTTMSGKEIEEHSLSRWTRNEPVHGPTALGIPRIVFSRFGVVEDDDLIVRHALASTSIPHTLDGHALWCLVVNKKTGHMSFYAIGSGKAKTPMVDRLNPPVASFVFSTMFRTYSLLVQHADGDETPWLFGGERRRALAPVLAKDTELVANRKLAANLDLLNLVGGAFRSILGGNVVDAPELGEGARVTELAHQPESDSDKDTSEQ